MRDLTTDGVWFFTDLMSADQAAAFVQRVESLGYSTLWIPEMMGRDPFAHLAFLGTATTELRLATGIANIFNREPGPMRQAANTVAEQTGGRMVLAMGVSHAPLVEGVRGLAWSKPLSTMRSYLDRMDASMIMGVEPAEPAPRLLAALGPKMLELAAERADGAHPYWGTPEHTATARSILGPDKLLCVEQKVCLTTDPSAARAAADGALALYATLPNYRNNWHRLGFSAEEIDGRAPRFVDAVVAWGDADTIKARLDEHRDAGATQICIQPLHPDNQLGKVDWDALEALAPGA
ncbi:MAG: TIGR03620 family F420-dependent LLM class oxidoreductase [Acidimicrobiales bacterium]|nr:TIGR03620 family F420-dependent LLM class oxidoreductase [Acidimicrobiales bacterium]